MQILEGVIGTVGAGTWQDGGRGGRTTLSVFEIGGHHVRRVVLPDYLRSFITPGERVRVMIGRGLSGGLITRPFIAAVEVRSRKYKVDGVLLKAALETTLYSLLVGGIVAMFSKVIALLACGAIATFYVKDYLQLKSF